MRVPHQTARPASSTTQYGWDLQGIGKYISSKDEIERDAVGAATFDPIEANKEFLIYAYILADLGAEMERIVSLQVD